MKDPPFRYLPALFFRFLKGTVINLLHAPGVRLMKDPPFRYLPALAVRLLKAPVINLLHAPGVRLLPPHNINTFCAGFPVVLFPGGSQVRMPPEPVKPHLCIRFLQRRIKGAVRTLVLVYLHNLAILDEDLNGCAARPVDTYKFIAVNNVIDSLTVARDFDLVKLVVNEIPRKILSTYLVKTRGVYLADDERLVIKLHVIGLALLCEERDGVGRQLIFP